MIYLSLLMALKDESVLRRALDESELPLGVEFFSMRYDAADMPALESKVDSFAGRPMTFHGPMLSAELTAKKGTPALDRSFDAYRRALALAQRASARHMVAHTHECFVTPEDKKDKMLRCEDNLRALARVAAPYGVRLSVENVSLPDKGAPLFDEEEYVALIKRLTECDALIDIGHVHVTGWHLETLTDRLKERVSGFHLHDNDGREDSHLWLSEGTLDLPAVQKLLRTYSEQKDIVLEYGDTEGKTSRRLLDDVAFVR